MLEQAYLSSSDPNIQVEWFLSLTQFRDGRTLLKNTDFAYVFSGMEEGEFVAPNHDQLQNLPFNCVPNNVHSILYEKGIIGNPYYRFEELKQLWVGLSDWKMECFVKRLTCKSCLLIFEGLDTVATVKINGKISRCCDNMFQYYIIDMSDHLINNSKIHIEIDFKSSLVECRERLEKHTQLEQYEIPCPSYTRDFDTRGRNFLRKSGKQFSIVM